VGLAPILAGAATLAISMANPAYAASAPTAPPMSAAPIQGMAAAVATTSDPTTTQIDATTFCTNVVRHQQVHPRERA
jgi:hypothetical protein